MDNNNGGIVKGQKGIAGCQIKTPPEVVELVWKIIKKYRSQLKSVVDYGAGDGRFAIGGNFKKYLGIEIDNRHQQVDAFPVNAELIVGDAIDSNEKFEACVGNPPYVRHHDIGTKWKQKAIALIKKETRYIVNGQCNIFTYFIWLALLRTHSNGIVALIVPYEWVSRPSVKPLREYIHFNKWKVDLYRFKNGQKIFPTVLTTASIIIIDKSRTNEDWNYFDIDEDFKIKRRNGITGYGKSVLPYVKGNSIRAQRGFSPGSQKVFTISEDQRIRHRINLNEVVPCVTTFKSLPNDVHILDKKSFRKYFINKGQKCWLLKTSGLLSDEVLEYLNQSPENEKKRWTCLNRDVWYMYKLSMIPKVLYASGFVHFGPKVVENRIGALGICSVHGIITEDGEINWTDLVDYLRSFEFESRIVPHAHTLKKIEVNQMNWVIGTYLRNNVTE